MWFVWPLFAGPFELVCELVLVGVAQFLAEPSYYSPIYLDCRCPSYAAFPVLESGSRQSGQPCAEVSERSPFARASLPSVGQQTPAHGRTGADSGLVSIRARGA